MRIKHLLVLLSIVASILFSNSVHAADWIYATVWINTTAPAGDMHLVKIDVNTGATTEIGICTVAGQPGHTPFLTALSMHTDGMLYSIDVEGSSDQIVKIDPTTAAATLVTSVGVDLDAEFGLAIELNGVYYMTGRELRKGTLPDAPVQIGSVDPEDTDSCDLAQDGTLYATDDGAFYTINKTTGVKNEITTWPTANVDGIAIDGPIAWAIDNGDNGTGNQWLVKINLSNGDLTPMHNLPDGYYTATALPNPNQGGIFFPIKSKSGKTSIIYLE